MSLQQLVERALAGDPVSRAKLVSLFSDTRPEATFDRMEAEEIAQKAQKPHECAFVGCTGAPGVGKSSLLSALVTRLRKQNQARLIAVLAIDPSSPFSGGALLGDRVRMALPEDDSGVFFRSQAADRELGGLSPATFQVCRMLRYLFDLVLVETVGVGQSETDIRHLADCVVLVVQPMVGDDVQLLKAGIMEIPDVIVMNKSDLTPAANQSFRALQTAAVRLLRPTDRSKVTTHRASARTGEGIDDLAALIADTRSNTDRFSEAETYFFEKAVRREFGTYGLDVLEAQGGAERVIEQRGFYEAQRWFARQIVV